MTALGALTAAAFLLAGAPPSSLGRVGRELAPAAFVDGELAPAEPGDIVVAVTGDFIPARAANLFVTDDGDFDAPLAEVAPLLLEADVAFVDLEAPLLDACPRTASGMVFCGHPWFARALAGAGVDVVSVANNHTENHALAGLVETVGHLESERMVPVGTGDPAFVDVIRGDARVRIAFLAFNAVSVGFAPKRAWIDAVASARPFADVVIVQVHWGAEYVPAPSATVDNVGAPDDPRELARALVHAGADLVVGNHPHWIQGLEIVRGVPVMYAHGNLFFDQLDAREMKESVIGLYRFRAGRVVDVAFVPVAQEGYRVRPLVGRARDAVLARVQARSRAVGR